MAHIKVNCLWAEWEEPWSECSVTCGSDGTRIKTRTKIQEASENPLGDSCIGSENKTQFCTVDVPCPGKNIR